MPSSSPAEPLIIDRYAIYASGRGRHGHGAPGASARRGRLLAHRGDQAAPPASGRRSDFAAMFIDEARLAARIRHPNVVPTLDVVSSGRRALPRDGVRARRVARAAARAATRDARSRIPVAHRGAHHRAASLHGLHAAHEAHRRARRAARASCTATSRRRTCSSASTASRACSTSASPRRSGASQTTRDGQIKGKLAYMAPEQIRGARSRRATDLFAAGVVLWERSRDERSSLGRPTARPSSTCFRRGSRRHPSSFPVCLGLDAVLERGLAREPSRRYATAREMARDLEGCIEAMRSSRFGAWVEEVGGEKVRERARQISEVEGRHLRPQSERPGAGRSSGESGGNADGTAVKHTRRVLTQPTEPVGPAAEATERPRAPAPQFESSQVAVHVRDQDEPSPPPRVRRRAPQVALVVAALGVAVAATYWWPKEPRGSPVAADVREQLAPAASLANADPVVAPSSTAPPAAALAPEIVATASAASPAVTPKPSHSAAGKTGRPAHRKPSAQCTPPYTIDSAGRRLFKLECM